MWQHLLHGCMHDLYYSGICNLAVPQKLHTQFSHRLAACLPAAAAVPGVVGDELGKAVDERSLPAWIWFMWIPQLLTSLTRPETHRVKPILKQLAEVRRDTHRTMHSLSLRMPNSRCMLQDALILHIRSLWVWCAHAPWVVSAVAPVACCAGNSPQLQQPCTQSPVPAVVV